MDRPRAQIGAAAAAAAAAILFLEADAGIVTATWPVEPNAGVLAANLPATEAVAQDMTLAAAGDGGAYLAWENAARTELRAQELAQDGARLWGDAGVAVRVGAVNLQPAGDRRVLANGPLDLVPTADGGLWIVWSEVRGVGRDLRAQRLDAAGLPLLAADGLLLFPDLPQQEGFAAVASDGADGLDVAVIPRSQILRLQHVAPDGTLTRGDAGVVVDGRPVEKRYPALARLPNGGVAVTWFAEDVLRLRVVRTSDTRVRGSGSVLARGVVDGFPSVRVVGGAHPSRVLVTYLDSSDRAPHVVLARRDGSVVFDERTARPEATAAKRLRDAPEITNVGGFRRGAPIGVELHGVAADGTAVRMVRTARSGRWIEAQAIVPPAPVHPGGTGALAGSVWAWDMGSRNADGETLRLVAYRISTVDERHVPRLGPWLALAPGLSDAPRLVRSGPWLHLAWVVPTAGNASIRATRVAVEPVPGEPEVFGPRIDELVVGVSDVATTTRTLDLAAPSASLPITSGQGLRLLLGDDGGTKAILLPLQFTGDASAPGPRDSRTRPDRSPPR